MKYHMNFEIPSKEALKIRNNGEQYIQVTWVSSKINVLKYLLLLVIISKMPYWCNDNLPSYSNILGQKSCVDGDHKKTARE